MTIIDNKITFSTGRTAYCHKKIIGLSPELQAYEGYDGYLRPDTDIEFGEIGYNFTREEREELADYMIALWTKYKEYK